VKGVYRIQWIISMFCVVAKLIPGFSCRFYIHQFSPAQFLPVSEFALDNGYYHWACVHVLYVRSVCYRLLFYGVTVHL